MTTKNTLTEIKKFLKEANYTAEEKCIQEKNCVACQIKHQMRFKYCCLYECGQHEFCKDCDKGIYLKG